MNCKRITAIQVISWRPCHRYPDDRVHQLVPGLGLTPLEIAALEIPHSDRIWVLLRLEVLGEQRLQAVLDRIVTRAVTNSALHCGVPAVERWAQRWLDGTNRTEAAAEAWAARPAAWAAAEAWAARAAAWVVAEAAARAAAEVEAWPAERMLQLYDIVHVLEGRP